MDALTRRAERARSKFSSKSSKVTKLGDSPKSSKFLKYRCCQAAPFPKIILRSAELPNPQNFIKFAVLEVLGVHYMPACRLSTYLHHPFPCGAPLHIYSKASCPVLERSLPVWPSRWRNSGPSWAASGGPRAGASPMLLSLRELRSLCGRCSISSSGANKLLLR